MEPHLDARGIVARTLALMGRNLGAVLLALAALTVNTIAQDFLPVWNFLYIIISIGVSLVVQYMVMRRAIAGAGIELAARKGLGTSFCGTAFGTGLLSGLALLLLIVPGVYLYLRWSIAVPLVLVEGKATDPAMSGSTAQTKGHLLQIGAAQLILNLPWFAGVALGFLVYSDGGPVPLALSALSALLAALGFVASWFAMIVTYTLLQPSHELEEVFA